MRNVYQQMCDYSSRFRILKGGKISLVVSSLIASTTLLHAAPSGGAVTAGGASIVQSGSVTNITQTTQKAAINWQNFSIGASETVNFNQPNINAVTLNRVVGNEKSIIDGALNANGQVFILNSNGVLFSKNASVNTAGLVATTMNLSDTDFMNGNYSFKGDSTASIINQGTITISDSGYAALFGKEVINEGVIKATLGKVHLTGASEVTLNLNGNSLVNLTVDKGALDALVENKGAIYADGGEVYLTTNAVAELLKGVVNNTGIIEANSIDDITGKVELYAHGGALHVNGTIEAEGGFVETSGKSLHVEDSTIIKTKKWLLDPDNVTIDNSAGDIGDATVGATAIQNALSTADIELQATTNITVNENITWSTDKQLKLSADSINVNKTIENTNTTNGGVYFNATNVRDKVTFGATGKVIIHNPYQLQWMNQALAGKYELGSDIDASVTSGWNGGKGWVPILTSVVYSDPMYGDTTIYYGFSGTFDGLGHTISNLTINDTTRDKVGFFGQTGGATVQNVGLVNVAITGKDTVGTLVGLNNNLSTIENAYATGSVSGASWVGGLVGENINSSTIKNSYAIVTVSATSKTAGGLAGLSFSNSPIINSYASGIVNGTTTNVGGLVGYYTGGNGGVTNSYYDNQANTGTMGDTGFGKTKAELLALVGGAWSNMIWGTTASHVSGYTTDTITLPFLRSVTKFDNTLFASGFGTSANPYTITNWTQLQNINYNTATLNKYFTLSNNIDNTTAGYTNSGEGWLSIGNHSNQFIGNFNGANHTISDLFIHRPTTDYIGLFGHTNTSATIQNIGIVNANITGSSYVGGLVGKSNRTTIANAYATGSVSGFSFVGGLVGSSYQGSITNAHATSSVTGTGDMIGGLVGSNSQTNIANTYARGSVTGTGTYVGGLVGFSYEGSITASFWDTQTSGQATSAGGVGKTTAELKKISTFENAGWNVGAGTSETPSLSMGGAYIWTMLPETVSYTLSDISNTYKGAAYTLSDLWNASTLFGASFSSWIAGTDYKFLDNNGNEITSYTNAGTYSNLHIDILRNGYNEASSGNTAGKFTITPKALTITGTTTANKVYDGSIASITTLGTLSGFIGTETVLASVVGTFADKNVATNITVTQSYTLADGINGGLASNYILANTTSQANITPASLTVIANNASKTYDGSVYSGGNGVSYGGFVNNETASVLGGSLSYGGDSQSATNAGHYVITASGLSSENYTLSYVDGILTIEASLAPTQDITPIITQIINGTAVTPPVLPSFTPLLPPAQAPQQFNVGGARVQLASIPSSDAPNQLVGTQEARAMMQGGGTGDFRVPLGQNSLIQLINGGVHLPDGLEQQFFMAQR